MIKERFLKYVSYPTMSDETSESCPSSKKQLELGKYLENELKEIGLVDVELDEHGYLYATLPANVENSVILGLIAHMDTSDACADEPIITKTVLYTGEDICLNEEKNIFLKKEEYPALANYMNNHLIVTDGTTLLGADDKAGIAAIVSALERIIKDSHRIPGLFYFGYDFLI